MYTNDTLQTNGWAFKLNFIWHSAGRSSTWTWAWGERDVCLQSNR